MSVTSTESAHAYVSDGFNTSYSFPNYFINQQDLLVQGLDPSGAVFTYEINADYVVSGVTNLVGDYPSGANVIFNVAPLAGTQVLIQRITNRTQDVLFFNNGPLTAEVLNHALDKLTLIVQEGFISGYLGVALAPPTFGYPTYPYGSWYKNGNPIAGQMFGWILTMDNVWNAFGNISLSF